MHQVLQLQEYNYNCALEQTFYKLSTKDKNSKIINYMEKYLWIEDKRHSYGQKLFTKFKPFVKMKQLIIKSDLLVSSLSETTFRLVFLKSLMGGNINLFKSLNDSALHPPKMSRPGSQLVRKPCTSYTG